MGPLLQTTLTSLWPLLVLAIALAVLGAVLRHPRVKGWRGERQVLRMIREGLNPHVYADLHNVTLPTEGGSTQIDHLIFSPYGLFVLETKNLKGWIFGSERQAEWTQKIHKNHSQKFQNPLRQSYKHTQTVQALLGLPAEQVHSVVAFVGDNQFKTEVPPQVLQGKAFIGYILQFQQPIWGPEEMQALIDRLEQHRLAPTRATQKAHAAHVQQLRADQAQAKAAQRAPAGKSEGAPVIPAEPAAPAVRPSQSARRAAPTPQQVAAAPLLQEVVARPAVEPVADSPQAPLAATTGPRTDDAATLPAEPAAAPSVRAVPPKVLSAVPSAVLPDRPAAQASAAAPVAPIPTDTAVAAPVVAPRPAAVVAQVAEKTGGPVAQKAAVQAAEGVAPRSSRPSRTCPQCQSALGRMRLQRGPLAGQVIYRCSNVSLCQYVQPLPDSVAAPTSA